MKTVSILLVTIVIALVQTREVFADDTDVKSTKSSKSSAPLTLDVCKQKYSDAIKQKSKQACPDTYLTRKITEDKKDVSWKIMPKSYYFGSVTETCSGSKPSGDKLDPNFECKLISDDNLTLGSDNPTIFSENSCYSEYGNEIVAEHYYLMNRLNMGELTTVDAIAEVENVLGVPAERRLQELQRFCSHKDNPRLKAWCDKHKSKGCGAGNGKEQMKKLIVQTQMVLSSIELLKEQMAKNCPDKPFKDGTRPQLECSAPYQKNIDRIASDNPWTQKAEFKNYLIKMKYSQSKFSQAKNIDLEGAIRAQFVKDKSDLINRLNKFTEAKSCLNDKSVSGTWDLDTKCGSTTIKTFKATIDDTPTFNFRELDKMSSAGLEVRKGFIYSDCKYTAGKAADEYRSSQLMLGSAVGLGAFGAGFGILARGLQIGARTHLAAGAQAQQLGRVAVLGIDLAGAVDGSYSALNDYSTCLGENKDKIETKLSEAAQNAVTSLEKMEPVCPGEKFVEPEIELQAKSCAMHAAMAGAMNALGSASVAIETKRILSDWLQANRRRIFDKTWARIEDTVNDAERARRAEVQAAPFGKLIRSDDSLSDRINKLKPPQQALMRKAEDLKEAYFAGKPDKYEQFMSILVHPDVDAADRQKIVDILSKAKTPAERKLLAGKIEKALEKVNEACK